MKSIRLELPHNIFNNNTNVIVYFKEDILQYIKNIYDFSTFLSIADYLYDNYGKQINYFYHNEDDHAYFDKKSNLGFYFLNGNILTEEEFNRHLHNIKFNDKLNLIIE